MTEELRKETAFHEAGHAAVVLALGLEIENAIMPPMSPFGEVNFRAVESSPEVPVAIIAGEVATAIEYKDCNVRKTVNALYIMPSAFKDSEDLQRLEKNYSIEETLTAMENAEKILHDHWRKVNEIARRLMTRDYIDGMELRRMW
jgi:hypothetical protein